MERLPCLRQLRQLIAAEPAGILPQLIQQPAASGVGEAPDDLQEVPGALRIGHGSRLSPLAVLRIAKGQAGVEALGLQVAFPGQAAPKSPDLALLLQLRQ